MARIVRHAPKSRKLSSRHTGCVIVAPNEVGGVDTSGSARQPLLRCIGLALVTYCSRAAHTPRQKPLLSDWPLALCYDSHQPEPRPLSSPLPLRSALFLIGAFSLFALTRAPAQPCWRRAATGKVAGTA